MTPNQNKAVWELCRQGLHSIAEAAEMAWTRGEPYRPQQHAHLPRETAHLITYCNFEITPQTAVA
ncbi:hypothetical protein F2Q65_04330 [Thiohalocapsa marina]|uniref:Uncharacterized protein n=1 Tax=Thiohalocapsa marina TaxID=424902 RepID=A0A5M8FT06_9GAMM|nr:hypothetical protein [Thiohalocapsa marina]KAA6186612.1 hypothetical protein F2Q65_04330 [Thiohalocapsa marina]